ncbi:MAG: ATP-binding protein [Clostridia bacterium]|nr:ATP-binding protein [Clostridia bacterium]
MKQGSSDYKLLTGLFFRLLPYQILLIVISAVNGIVDSLYASNMIGKTAMSAIGLFGPLNHFLYAASIMLVSGTQILYGRYLAKDREKIHGLLTINLIVTGGLALLTSLLLALGVLTGATGILVSQEPDLQMLNQYILGQAIGIPALLLGQQLFAFLSLENQSKRTMAASISCFAVNAVLDHLFIVVFPLGTFGLGLSSSIASWVFLAVQVVYYLAGKSEWKFSLHACRWQDAPRIAGLGYPGALSRFVEMFRCLIVNFLVLRYVGSVGLSAFAASNSLLAVIWAVPFGMVAVSRMLFSISIGEEDRRSLIDVLKISQTRGMLLMGCIVALLILLAEPMTRLFYRDPSDPVYQMTVMGFRILPLCMPPAMLSLHFASYTQTMEKRIMSVILPVVDGMVGVVLFSFLLIPPLKMNGLYIANILNGILCFIVIAAGAWIILKRCPRTLEDLMAIPVGFGVPADKRIDITVRSMEEVMNVSRQITDFCSEQGIDPRRTFLAGLCMEEMAGNVVTHGFSKDTKQHSADIRVAYKGDEIILRIRDNCRAFNPSEWIKVMEPGELGRNVGIQLVWQMASDVSYQNLLGLNVLTIRL